MKEKKYTVSKYTDYHYRQINVGIFDSVDDMLKYFNIDTNVYYVSKIEERDQEFPGGWRTILERGYTYKPNV